MAESSLKYGVNRVVIQRWKKEALSGLSDLFSSKGDRERMNDQALISGLYQQIGQLTVEVD